LIVLGERRHELSLLDIRDAYARRYDLEPFFRFGKQKLLLASFQTPEDEREETCWQLLPLAYAQLWVARHVARLFNWKCASHASTYVELGSRCQKSSSRTGRKIMAHSYRRLTLMVLSVCLGALLTFSLLMSVSRVSGWAEEGTELKPLYYYDPLDPRPIAQRATYTPGVSSIHFDLVGAFAVAAGFSVTDAATLQAYSQGTDSGKLPGANPVYVFDANPNNYPLAPPITSVITSTICPSPATTAPTVTLGSTDVMTENGNTIEEFTSRFGPYGVFFHEPHNRPDELGAIHDWAFGKTDVLTGVVTFGYSSTVTSVWPRVYQAKQMGNIYAATACFVTETVRIDTGSIQPGSLKAMGIYLHSLGDYWSHRDCISAVDSLGLPFAAHVYTPGIRLNDPLYPCRWDSHKVEFGPANTYPESNRTFTGTVEVYEALYAYALQSNRTLYRPISLTDEGDHILNTLYEFVHDTGLATNTRIGLTRRTVADQLRTWALQTRQANPVYWKYRAFLPALMK